MKHKRITITVRDEETGDTVTIVRKYVVAAVKSKILDKTSTYQGIGSFFGKLDAEDVPSISMSDGSEYYYINNKLSRNDEKPAVTTSGGKEKRYMVNGKKHRIGGPAVEFTEDAKQNEWALAGRTMKYEEYLNHMTLQCRTKLILKYGAPK